MKTFWKAVVLMLGMTLISIILILSFGVTFFILDSNADSLFFIQFVSVLIVGFILKKVFDIIQPEKGPKRTKKDIQKILNEGNAESKTKNKSMLGIFSIPFKFSGFSAGLQAFEGIKKEDPKIKAISSMGWEIDSEYVKKRKGSSKGRAHLKSAEIKEKFLVIDDREEAKIFIREMLLKKFKPKKLRIKQLENKKDMWVCIAEIDGEEKECTLKNRKLKV